MLQRRRTSPRYPNQRPDTVLHHYIPISQLLRHNTIYFQKAVLIHCECDKRWRTHQNDFGHPAAWNVALQDTLQAVPGLRTVPDQRYFTLMPEACHSTSELRNLSGLEITDGCTNYRTDPVRV